jgi:hypothetical protein
LDTPEALAAVTTRLRKHASAVADRDLSRAYRDAFYDWRGELRPRRRDGARAGGATAEACAAAIALRRSADDVVTRLLALPPENVDGHAERLFELHDRLGEIQTRMDALREAMSTTAQMAEFAALKAERDGLRRQIKEEPMAGGVA